MGSDIGISNANSPLTVGLTVGRCAPLCGEPINVASSQSVQAALDT